MGAIHMNDYHLNGWICRWIWLNWSNFDHFDGIHVKHGIKWNLTKWMKKSFGYWNQRITLIEFAGSVGQTEENGCMFPITYSSVTIIFFCTSFGTLFLNFSAGSLDMTFKMFELNWSELKSQRCCRLKHLWAASLSMKNVRFGLQLVKT